MKQKDSRNSSSTRNIRKVKNVVVLNSPDDLLAIGRMNKSAQKTRTELQIAIAKSHKRAEELIVF
jgi:archaeosine-15-forming tRNA-guanine transglycosylase